MDYHSSFFEGSDYLDGIYKENITNIYINDEAPSLSNQSLIEIILLFEFNHHPSKQENSPSQPNLYPDHIQMILKS